MFANAIPLKRSTEKANITDYQSCVLQLNIIVLKFELRQELFLFDLLLRLELFAIIPIELFLNLNISITFINKVAYLYKWS